jgi:hypothetical protein
MLLMPRGRFLRLYDIPLKTPAIYRALPKRLLLQTYLGRQRRLGIAPEQINQSRQAVEPVYVNLQVLARKW